MKMIIDEYAGAVIYVIAGLMMTGVFWQLLERMNGN